MIYTFFSSESEESNSSPIKRPANTVLEEEDKSKVPKLKLESPQKITEKPATTETIIDSNKPKKKVIKKGSTLSAEKPKVKKKVKRLKEQGNSTVVKKSPIVKKSPKTPTTGKKKIVKKKVIKKPVVKESVVADVGLTIKDRLGKSSRTAVQEMPKPAVDDTSSGMKLYISSILLDK